MNNPKNPRELFLIRDYILEKNKYNTYKDFLNPDYWKMVKEKTKDKKHLDNYNHCWICRTDKKIQLHHNSYKWLLTKDELRDIVSLCKNCHSELHKMSYEKDILFKKTFEIMRDLHKLNQQ